MNEFGLGSNGVVMSRTGAMISPFEWPTLSLILICLVVWFLGIGLIGGYSTTIGFFCVALSVALYSSLQHEVIHGHPTRSQRLNEALVFPALSIFIPFGRFRDTHLAHHSDIRLTDPFEDPESNYFDPEEYARLSAPIRALLCLNNTLLGRVIFGPAIGQVMFMKDDWRRIKLREEGVLQAWIAHAVSLALVLAVYVTTASLPVWAFLLATYLGLGLIRIRTFLEHRADEQAEGRTAIIEDRGPLSFLFLNNNLHAVHHLHPAVPWYQLPKLYFRNRQHFLSKNRAYVFSSYAEVVSKFLLRRKDPVAHPIWRRG